MSGRAPIRAPLALPRTLRLATALVVAAVAVAAATPARAKVTLQGTATASAGWTDNVLDAPDEQIPNGPTRDSDFFFQIAPGAILTSISPRLLQRLAYTFTADLFVHHTEANSYSNALEWAGNVALTKTMNLLLTLQTMQGRLSTFNLNQASSGASITVLPQNTSINFFSQAVTESLDWTLERRQVAHAGGGALSRLHPDRSRPAARRLRGAGRSLVRSRLPPRLARRARARQRHRLPGAARSDDRRAHRLQRAAGADDAVGALAARLVAVLEHRGRARRHQRRRRLERSDGAGAGLVVAERARRAPLRARPHRRRGALRARRRAQSAVRQHLRDRRGGAAGGRADHPRPHVLRRHRRVPARAPVAAPRRRRPGVGGRGARRRHRRVAAAPRGRPVRTLLALRSVRRAAAQRRRRPSCPTSPATRCSSASTSSTLRYRRRAYRRGRGRASIAPTSPASPRCTRRSNRDAYGGDHEETDARSARRRDRGRVWPAA